MRDMCSGFCAKCPHYDGVSECAKTVEEPYMMFELEGEVGE
jgi:hypothetical protein